MLSSTSDNKNKEELEDCGCGSESNNLAVDSSSSTTPAAGANTAAAPLQQQNILNTFDNKKTSRSNSNSSSRSSGSNFSGNNSNISQAKISGGGSGSNKINEEQQQFKKELEDAIETIDSGFISGPQTEDLSSHLDNDDEEEDCYDSNKQTNEFKSSTGGSESGSGGGGGTQTKLPEESKTTVGAALLQQKQHLNIAAEAVADSGCIEDEEIEEEGIDKEEQQQQYNRAKAEQKYETTSSSHLAADSATVNAAEDHKMILKGPVDSNIAEWFSNLSVQNPTTSPQQQQHQLQHQSASVAGTTMNNLGGGIGDRRRSATIATSETIISDNYQCNRQQTPQQQAPRNNATTTAKVNITPSTAWEQFYQQNDDGDTPLHLACIYGNVDVVAALIRMAPHPCLFNIQNDEAQTPLHLAALTAQPKILRMLLIAGAEPQLRDRHGNTALHLVCMSGEEQCVRALTIPISASEINEAHRQYGHRSNDKTVSYLSCARLPSDLEIRNYDGERCVHLAAQSGHIDVLRILVLYGADINAREGKSGRTPLHIATESCNVDLANFLLDEFLVKINLETATYAGLTAYQVACMLNKSNMQSMLKKYGAEPLTPPESDYDSDIESDLEDSKMYDRFGDPGYFNNFKGYNPMKVA